MGDLVSEVFNEAMRPSINSLIFQFLFYGGYVILGGMYVSLELKQRGREKKFQHPFYPISLFVLFSFATAGIIISVYDVENVLEEFIVVGFTELDPTSREKDLVNYRTALGALYGSANWVADAILVYRCYHVWNGKIWVPAIPAVLSVLNAAVAYAATATIKLGSNELFATGESNEVNAGDDLNYVFLGITVFSNLVLTGLIAGRIWWSNRVHSRLLGIDSHDKRLSAMVTMFIESGTLYPIALIVCLIIQVKGSTATMDPILLQIVGIVPTLIMVRTSLGLGVDGAAPAHDDNDQNEADANLKLSSRYPTDVKGALTSISPSHYPATSTFTSDYVTTPLKLEPSSSMTGSGHGYTHIRMQSVNNRDHDKAESIPAYDFSETGTGFRPEKMTAPTELKYDPSVTLASMTPNRSYSEAGPNEIGASSSRSQYHSNEKLQPVRYPFQAGDAV